MKPSEKSEMKMWFCVLLANITTSGWAPYLWTISAIMWFFISLREFQDEKKHQSTEI